MGLTGRFSLVFLLLLVLLGGGFTAGSENYAAAADSCDLARDFAADAARTFKKDPQEGVRLFHKALRLCDRDPRYKYNLGLAYYRYGNARESEKYLAAAVKQDGSRAVWLHDLASVMLENGSSSSKALKYAEKAYRLGKDDSSLGPLVVETYARAQLASGEGLAAIKVIDGGRRSWPQDKSLQRIAGEIEKEYVHNAILLMKKGESARAFKVLEEASIESPLAAKTWCLALSKAGRGAAAMTAATSLKYSQPSIYDEVWGELVVAESNRLFTDFRSGKEIDAMMEAKTISEKYPADRKLKAVYDDLFNAFRNDRKELVVAKAEPRVRASKSAADLDIEKSLDGIYAKTEVPVAEAGLEVKVDMDENIPQGRYERESGIAVVIGNCRYARQGKGIPDVKYADRDAFIMKKYLIKTMGFKSDNILYYNNATGSDLRTVFGTPTDHKGRLYNYIRAGKSDVFVYYVGHGAPGKQGKAAFLVPVDASIDYISSSGYSVNQLYDNLNQLPAKSLMVVLDACFSGDSQGGKLFDNISPGMVKNINPVREIGKNSFVLCGADKDQVCAWYPQMRHSLLTYYFLKGLQGKADANSDNKITATEMGVWLKSEVPYRARRITGREQQPQIRGNLNMVLVEFKK